MSEDLISYEQLKEKIDYLLGQGEKIVLYNDTLSESAFNLIIGGFSFHFAEILIFKIYKVYLENKPLVVNKKDINKIMTFLIDEYKKQELKEYNEITLKEFEKIGK